MPLNRDDKDAAIARLRAAGWNGFNLRVETTFGYSVSPASEMELGAMSPTGELKWFGSLADVEAALAPAVEEQYFVIRGRMYIKASDDGAALTLALDSCLDVVDGVDHTTEEVAFLKAPRLRTHQ